jgi:hypothetical protein
MLSKNELQLLFILLAINILLCLVFGNFKSALNISKLIITLCDNNNKGEEKEGKICGPGVELTSCFIDPCMLPGERVCRGFLNAECRANYCGGCFAEWYLNNVRVDCGETSERSSTAIPRPCKRNACFLNPCLVSTCDGHPGAVCVPNYCGGCNAEYFLNGTRVYC